MRGGLIVLVMCGWLAAAPAGAACENDTIETISEDGDLIIVASGQAYDVSAPDQSMASLWQEGDSVRICGGTMINTDERGESIKVAPH